MEADAGSACASRQGGIVLDSRVRDKRKIPPAVRARLRQMWEVPRGAGAFAPGCGGLVWRGLSAARERVRRESSGIAGFYPYCRKRGAGTYGWAGLFALAGKFEGGNFVV